MIDLLLFFRVKDWLHMLGLILLGFVYSSQHLGLHGLPLAFLVGSLYLAHGYSLNDVYDGQIKARASHLQPLFLSLASLILCLAGSAFVSFEFFCVVLFGHLCGMFYSARPFRFKNKLWLDLIFNSFSLAPLFLLGYLVNHDLSFGSLGVTALIFLYFIPVQLLHQMSDCATDLERGQKNTFQILGFEKTRAVLCVSLTIFILANLLLWKLSVLSLSSSLAGHLFAVALFIYIYFRLSSRTPSGRNSFTRAKIDTRYLSIVYGLLLFLSFYRPNP